jgi:endonuclease III
LAKQDPATAQNFAALLNKALSAYKGDDPPPRDPVGQLIVSFLNWNATRSQAEDAFTAIMGIMIDVNDLRVSHPHELIEIIGTDYPAAGARIIRLREALNEVYLREHDIHMHSIAGKGKKEQRAYLDTLPGIAPFIAAQVTLLSFGGHAMPVDEKLTALLISEGCLEEGTTPGEAEAFLVRQVKAGDALEAHLALQAWADKRKMPAAADLDSPTTGDADQPIEEAVTSPPVALAKAPAKAAKKKTTKKKTVRKKK